MAKERKTSIKFEVRTGRAVVVARYKGQYAISCPGLRIRLVRKAEEALEHVSNVLLPPHPDGTPNPIAFNAPGEAERLLLSIAELALDDRT